MGKKDIFNVGSPVNDFVSSFIDGLENALSKKGYITCREEDSHAKMELNAIATVGTSGKGGAKIIGIAGGSLQKENTNVDSQKITIFIKKPTNLDKEEEKASIQIAKEKQKMAKAIALRNASVFSLKEEYKK